MGVQNGIEMSLKNVNVSKALSENEVVNALKELGVPIIYKPVAVVGDDIEMDVYQLYGQIIKNKKIEPLDCELSEDAKNLIEFTKEMIDEINNLPGIPKKYLIPKTVVCHKCNSVHVLPEGRDYVICCGEVINHSYGPYD